MGDVRACYLTEVEPCAACSGDRRSCHDKLDDLAWLPFPAISTTAPQRR